MTAGRWGIQPGGDSQEKTWLTPPEVIHALGRFDLDPATPEVMPWKTAGHRYTEKDDGLASPWFGRVWLNPPYGRDIDAWMEKMADHGNGVALVAARTDTQWFQRYVFGGCHSVLFVQGRLTFRREDGGEGKGTFGR